MSFFGGNPFASPVGQKIGKDVIIFRIVCMILSVVTVIWCGVIFVRKITIQRRHGCNCGTLKYNKRLSISNFFGLSECVLSNVH